MALEGALHASKGDGDVIYPERGSGVQESDNRKARELTKIKQIKCHFAKGT